MVVAGPGADQMKGALAPGGVKGSAKCFAVDGDQLAVRGTDHGMHPVQETLAKGGRIHQRENPAQRVMRRNAVGQFQKGGEPTILFQAIALNIGPAFSSGDDSTQGESNDIEQAMQSGVRGAGVVKLGKMV